MSVRAQIVGVLVATTLTVAACSSDSDASGTPVGEEAPSLYDSSVVHEVDVTFDQGDYDAMIATFADTGEKEWIEATVTVDGETYEQVGLRLKGNSSLMGLRGGSGGRGPQRGGDAAESPEPADDTTETSEPAEPTEDPTGEDGTDGPGGGFGAGGATAEEPERLPWLIRFNELVDDQEHQGHEYLNIRSNNSETSLNEAVALDLLEEAGLMSQQAAATSFSVNGSDAVLRLGIEIPDDDAWQDANLESDGAVYKAKSTGDWSYRGDDPDAYDEDVFEQKGGKNTTDLTPLIDFLQFVNESDDETFAAELPERLDVESFATYLAMMDLLENWDDIDGPGNNAYISYDVETEQFTVVPWDMNLAFGSGFGGGEGGRPGGFEPPADGEFPEGFEPPAEGEAPEGFEPGGGGGGFGRSNVLVERFHDNDDFEALYQQKLTELRASLYESDVADSILDAWVETLTKEAGGLVDEATITDEAEAIREQFTAE